eukprot:3523842-Pleurochrysis_carterae.AAC.1
MKPAPDEPHPKWHCEVKPTIADAAANGMILAFAAAMLQLAVIVLAFDFATLPPTRISHIRDLEDNVPGPKARGRGRRARHWRGPAAAFVRRT